MMRDTTALSPEQPLIDGFADHVVAWAIEAGASRETLRTLRQLAKEVCSATVEGHVCVFLERLLSPEAATEARQHLFLSGVVGTPAAPASMPLILDDEGRLYLHRYYDYELRLACRLLATQAGSASPPETTRKYLDTFFGIPSDQADWPRIAAALALQRKLLIISGGPGTGKTTTIVNLLACLLEENPDCRIALAAPTGKAAARMQETVRTRAAHLPPAIQARLPDESFTIHRLLGVTSYDGSFLHHADNPLPVDAVIIDEASMLDIALAAQLFDAIPLHARIILLGDKDQLSAVEAGAVFSELSADPTLTPACTDALSCATGIPAERIVTSPPRKSSGLHDSVIWFTKQFRFAGRSHIAQLAHHVGSGEADAAIALLRQTSDASLSWMEDEGKTLLGKALARIMENYAAYQELVLKNPENTALIFDAFDRFRVLCAIKDGPRGIDAINREMDRHFRLSINAHPGESRHAPRDASARTAWYPGRPVIIQRNDYVLKLFNGDVGIALPDTSDGIERLMVYFPENAGDGERGFRTIAPSRLPEHETAFAMTVHKSQGSEFEAVLLMMPDTPNRVARRELLYTAITRARENVTLCASETMLRHVIASPTQRNSGLASRIKIAAKPFK